MGTRADFYIGTGLNAEWLGSVAYDGYKWQEDPNCALMQAKTEGEFRKAVADISDRDDWTAPEQGWPWPWKDSCTTDRQYAFVDGKTQAFSFGRPIPQSEDEEQPDKVPWPDMSQRKNITLGARSGLMVFGVNPNTEQIELVDDNDDQ